MKPIEYGIVVPGFLALATSARAAVTTYECTLTLGPDVWQEAIALGLVEPLNDWDSPITALPPGDRFTLRFSVDGSSPMYSIPASWPLDEYGSFDRPVVLAGTIAPWPTNIGSGFGQGQQALDFVGNYEMLYGTSFTSASRDVWRLSPSYRAHQLFVSVIGPTYSAASVGLGLDQLFGPLSEGTLRVQLGLEYAYEADFWITFDVTDFHIVPCPARRPCSGWAE